MRQTSAASDKKNAPSILKADIWAHFGFYELTGKHEMDKMYTVCKICQTKIENFGNPTNLRNHVNVIHPELTSATITNTAQLISQELRRRCQLATNIGRLGLYN